MALTFRGMTLQRIAFLEWRKMRRRMTERKNKVTRPNFGPSFYQSLQYRRAYWSELVARHGMEDELYPENSKLSCRAIAHAADVRMPALLDGPVSASELRPLDYGEQFVIKPDWGASSRGVMVLRKQKDGSFVELISGDRLDHDEIAAEAEQRVVTSRRGSVNRLIVEESVADGDTRPMEWKIFSFHGEVGLVQQMARGAGDTEMRLYRPDGTSAGRLRKDVVINQDLPEPGNLSELLDIARRVSLEINSGFVRVDLFERINGEIIFGELSLIPGGDLYFGRDWDRHLGQMWFDAEVRILEKGVPIIP
ncbi:hypothetical protein EJO69_11370 [Flaviflexus salsibiostraticola]|uniref:ATP-grasp domain-containing protein n=1 Tax=Flaviflexus salsibiostraticola TaxID=1282737 RepID=A0A3S8ZBL1_9ACTO|nr:ATP-grasp fold amidoligase family protein [Flaviflexus salsibiostraticola]AZN30835.1 hypothetical protein EJO69_11370 [Flaviflexus salsibiostraticola]